ncbi:MAG TPA: glycoside hydrolase family 15 protein [Lacunisphaera sp.]|jgi:glucoamylase
MDAPLTNPAPGAPGIQPRWTSSAKDAIGTAYSTGSHVWFTLSHGIVNEIYYPHVDTPNTRDLQLLITDGETFCHEEKRDLDHHTEYPEQNALLCRIVSNERNGRYRITKEIIGEAHSSVVLIDIKLEILDDSLRGKLRAYALLAPHLDGTGSNNSANCCEVGGRALLHAHRKDVHLMFGCAPDFTRRSIGCVGESDGWRDLMDNFTMDWQYDGVKNSNLAMIGEIDLSRGLDFTLAVAFGFSVRSASTALLQAFATPFAAQREKYVTQWQRTRAKNALEAPTDEGNSMVRLSQCVLLAHEDKVFPGAFVASLSIPWGETKDDSDRGGYHLVWTRDMVQTATALLACGQTESPLRALIWLACIQGDDGSLPQNSSISGKAYWHGIQLDEVAVPVLLAWRLHEANGLRQFDPWTLVSRAASYLILHGPVTGQERWEENSGYSPSTIATLIAALVCAAEFAHQRSDEVAARLLLDYADWLNTHVDDWTSTTCGELVSGRPRHYIRITPAAPADPLAAPDPDHATINIANGGGTHPARNIVGGDFLHLVRLGIRDALDPLVTDSVAVLDAILKRELPQGPCWRRYNFDGYGQKPDGSAYDGTGEGRSWPILTGERGHYEIAAGRDPSPLITAMEKFSNAGGMLPEQVWDAPDLPDGRMIFGQPTGSAMPLCWAHAEYLSLVRSHKDGVCFDRPEPVYQRYVKSKTRSTVEMWTFAHQLAAIEVGKKLRLIVAAPGGVHWSADGWNSTGDVEMRSTGLGCWFADLETNRLPSGANVTFTFRWQEKWEGRDFAVVIHSSPTT